MNGQGFWGWRVGFGSFGRVFFASGGMGCAGLESSATLWAGEWRRIWERARKIGLIDHDYGKSNDNEEEKDYDHDCDND